MITKTKKTLVTDEQFGNWQRWIAKQEELQGHELFLGMPDRWYRDKDDNGDYIGNSKPLHGCINGHVSDYLLKDEEKGYCCLECNERAIFIPPEINTDEKLQKLFKSEEFLITAQKANQ